MSSRFRSTTGTGSASGAAASGASVQAGMSNADAASPIAGPSSCHTMASAAPASARTYSVSGRVDIVFTGTTTHPAA